MRRDCLVKLACRLVFKTTRKLSLVESTYILAGGRESNVVHVSHIAVTIYREIWRLAKYKHFAQCLRHGS